jgi:Zn-dependent protease/predicted transcriptional regulator
MRGSLKIFTWFRIPVYLHWTFGLPVLYALWTWYDGQHEPETLLMITGFLAALATCVLLHEYGHSLMARRYGVNTQDILLTPIGGIARLERMPEKPMQEFLVAIAGPMVNVVIALLLLGISLIVFRGEDWEVFKWLLGLLISKDGEAVEIPDGPMFFIAWLLISNCVLVLFNLIPAFPMDGGRIFRSLLSMRLGRVRATRMASFLGQGIALVFISGGFFWSQPMLAVVGLFVFMTARTENSMVQLDALLRRFLARDVVRTDYTRLLETDWMQTAAELLRQGPERDFLVFNFANQLTGYLEKEQIQDAVKKHDLSAPVAQYLSKPVQVVAAGESLHYVHYLIRYNRIPIVAISDGDQLIGVIDETGLLDFVRGEK